jgi:nucleotide-binding universal stress UspA family protein
MNTVLVPIDGSDASLRALALAVKEVDRCPGSALHLLNVQAPELHVWPGKSTAEGAVDPELHQRGMALMAKAVDMTLGSGLNIVMHVRAGHVAGQIVRCAEDHACDGIVMGTRGMGAAAGVALGSVATKVVRLSRLPVTLVK